MAYIVYVDKTTKTVPHEIGVAIWEALQHPENQSDSMLDRLARIKSIYLNRKKAPQSYLDYHRDILNAMDNNSKPIIKPATPALPGEPWYQK